MAPIILLLLLELTRYFKSCLVLPPVPYFVNPSANVVSLLSINFEFYLMPYGICL